MDTYRAALAINPNQNQKASRFLERAQSQRGGDAGFFLRAG
jgi:hypothetical protein